MTKAAIIDVLDKITERFPYLEKIILPKFGDGLSSITCLMNLPHLHSLNLIHERGQDIEDFDTYAVLTQLTHLTVGVSSRDLAKLSTLTNLVSLYLSCLMGSSPAEDKLLNMVKNMTQLTYLWTPHAVWWQRGCSMISHLTNLKTLIIANSSWSIHAGLDLLSNLVNLEHADINGSVTVKHIRHWTNLTSLKMSNTNIIGDSFHRLSSLQNLRLFVLSNADLSTTTFATLAQCTELQQITFDQVKWIIDTEEGVNPYAEEEMPYNPKEDKQDKEYTESEQTRARWDLLSSMTQLTSLKRLIGLPYHRALDTRIKFFPQSLTSFSIEGIHGDPKVLYQSLVHFTQLAALAFEYHSGSLLSNDTIDILSQLTALSVLHIDSREYGDGIKYKIWKQAKDSCPTPDLDPDQQSKVLTFPNLNLSAFARLTQLTSLHVSQDPYEEEELWTLTALQNLEKITLGWHFNTKNFVDFLRADLRLDKQN